LGGAERTEGFEEDDEKSCVRRYIKKEKGGSGSGDEKEAERWNKGRKKTMRRSNMGRKGTRRILK
jgi:hypothetical protein